MKAVIADMDKNEPDKATQTLLVSTSLHHCSNIYQDLKTPLSEAKHSF